MRGKPNQLILPGMLVGVILGAVLGYIVPEVMLALGFIGELFVNALKLLVIPLIFVTVVVGMASLGNLKRVGRVSCQALWYYLVTTCVAVIIGLVLVCIIRPGAGVTLFGVSPVAELVILNGQSVSGILGSLIPDSIPGSLVAGQYLGLILFALFFGGALAAAGTKGRTVLSFVREAGDIIMYLVRLVCYAAPLGLFAIVGQAVALNHSSLYDMAHGLGWLSLTLFLGLLIHGVLVLPLILKFFARRSPVDYYRNLSPAILTALGTSSSTATLPVTYECVVEKNQVSNRAGSLVLPLGSVANLDGTAMYLVIAAVFVAQAGGVALGGLGILAVIATAVLVSIGAAGVPSAGLLMLGVVLSAAGIPLELAMLGATVILTLDWLFDRVCTVVNVLSDAVGSAVVAESVEMKTARRVTRASGTTHVSKDHGRDRSDRRTRVRSDGRRDRRSSESPRHSDRRPPRRTENTGPVSGRARTSAVIDEPSPFNVASSDGPALGVEDVETDVVDVSGAGAVGEGRTRHGRSHDNDPHRDRDTSGDEKRDERYSGSERRTGGPRSRRDGPRSTVARSSRRDTGSGGATRGGRREERPARTEEETVTDKPAPSMDEDAVGRARLDPATVARELARVSAQLQETPRNDEDTNKEPEPESPATGDLFSPSSVVSADSVDETSRETSAYDSREHDDPAPSEDESWPSERAASDQPEEPQRETETEVDDEEAMAFGRTRSRRGEKLRHEGLTEEEKKLELPEVKDGYSTEDASFGRSKRKRTR